MQLLYGEFCFHTLSMINYNTQHSLQHNTKHKYQYKRKKYSDNINMHEEAPMLINRTCALCDRINIQLKSNRDIS